jgi:hypothetical protein
MFLAQISHKKVVSWQTAKYALRVDLRLGPCLIVSSAEKKPTGS